MSRITRNLDSLRVKIEEVNLSARVPLAKGRIPSTGGIIDIDLNGATNIPVTGEYWWIDRITGRWRLRDTGRATGIEDSMGRIGKSDIWINFLVTEAGNTLEYQAFVGFDSIQKDENYLPSKPDSYVIEWIPCLINGTPRQNETVRQQIWMPGDPEIDPPEDYDLPNTFNTYTVILQGSIVNPKSWWWKARVRGVINGIPGAWSDWSDPALPSNTAMPLPPIPSIKFEYQKKENKTRIEYQGVVTFRSVGWWDLPGGDSEDDVQNYETILEPIIPIYDIVTENSITTYEKIAIPSGLAVYPEQGTQYEPDEFDIIYNHQVFRPLDPIEYPVLREIVESNDEEDSSWVQLGTLAQRSPMTETDLYIDETVDGQAFVWPDSVDDLSETTNENFIIRMNNIHYSPPDLTVDTDERTSNPYIPPLELPQPFSEYEEMYVTLRDTNATYIKQDGPATLDGTDIYHYRVARPFWGPGGESDGDNHYKGDAVEVYFPNHRYRVTFTDLYRSKDIYWHAKIRTTDRFNRSSSWGEWTEPKLPGVIEDDWLFEGATGVAIDFDRVNEGSSNKWSAKVSWNEAQQLTSEDSNSIYYNSDNVVTHYGVQLASSNGSKLVGPVTAVSGDPQDENPADPEVDIGIQALTITGGAKDSEVQNLTIPLAGSGTFTLTWLNKTTSKITYSTDQEELASSIEDALIAAIPALVDNITVTVLDETQGLFAVEWSGVYANTNVELLQGDGSSLIMNQSGESTDILCVSDTPGKYSKFKLSFNDGSYKGSPLLIADADWSDEQILFVLDTLEFSTTPSYKIETGDVIVVDEVSVNGNVNNRYNGSFKVLDVDTSNKVITVDCPVNPGTYSSGGSVNIEANIATTDYIGFDATAEEIQDALETLPYISDGDIEVVDDGGGVFKIKFLSTGGYVGTSIPLIVPYINSSDDGFSVTVTEEQAGGTVAGGFATMEVLCPYGVPKAPTEMDDGGFFFHLVAPGDAPEDPIKYEVFEVIDYVDTLKNEIMTIFADPDFEDPDSFFIYYKEYLSRDTVDENTGGQNRNTETPIQVYEINDHFSTAEYQAAMDKFFGQGNTLVTDTSDNRFHKIEFIGELANKDIQSLGKLYVDYGTSEELTPGFDYWQNFTARAVLYYAGDGVGELENVTKQHGGTTLYTVNRAKKGTNNYGSFYKAEGYIDYSNDDPEDQKFLNLYLYNLPYFRQKISTEEDIDRNTRASAVFDRNIRPYHRYQARVRFFDSYSRQSKWSDWKSIQGQSPKDESAPPPPIILEAYITNESEIYVDWEGPLDPKDPELMYPNFDHYRVEIWEGTPSIRVGSNLPTGKLIKTIRNTLNSYVEFKFKKRRLRKKKEITKQDEDVVKRYTVRVCAVDTSGNRSDWAIANNINEEVPQKPQGIRLKFKNHESGKKEKRDKKGKGHKRRHPATQGMIDSIVTWDEYNSSYFDINRYEVQLQTGDVLGRVVSIDGDDFGLIGDNEYYVHILVLDEDVRKNPLGYPVIDKSEIERSVTSVTRVGDTLVYTLGDYDRTGPLSQFAIGEKVTTGDSELENVSIIDVTADSFTVDDIIAVTPGARSTTATVTGESQFAVTFSDKYNNSFDEMALITDREEVVITNQVLVPALADLDLPEGYEPVVVKYTLTRDVPSDVLLAEQNLDNALPFSTGYVKLEQGYFDEHDTEPNFGSLTFDIVPAANNDTAALADGEIAGSDESTTYRKGTMYILVLASNSVDNLPVAITVDSDEPFTWEELPINGTDNWIVSYLGDELQWVILSLWYGIPPEAGLPNGLTKPITVTYNQEQQQLIAQIIRVDGANISGDISTAVSKIVAGNTNYVAEGTRQ